MSGLHTPILHGLGNLKAICIGRFFRSFFLRFRLLIFFTGDSTIASANAGKTSSAIAFFCSMSRTVSVAEISVFLGYFSRSSLDIFLGGVFVSISFASCVVKCEFLSIFRLVIFFTDRVIFTDDKSESSSSIYFCFSCGLQKNVI